MNMISEPDILAIKGRQDGSYIRIRFFRTGKRKLIDGGKSRNAPWVRCKNRPMLMKLLSYKMLVIDGNREASRQIIHIVKAYVLESARRDL